jgi:hypothetical protein
MITGVPETFLIGADGILRHKFIGPYDWSSQEIRNTILEPFNFFLRITGALFLACIKQFINCECSFSLLAQRKRTSSESAKERAAAHLSARVVCFFLRCLVA